MKDTKCTKKISEPGIRLIMSASCRGGCDNRLPSIPVVGTTTATTGTRELTLQHIVKSKLLIGPIGRAAIR
jgi:hypothetical protein